MRRISEIAGNTRYAILGGRTLRENHEWWLDRVRREAHVGGVNHVPLPPAQEVPPEEGTEDEALIRHLRRCGVPDRAAEILKGTPEPTHALQVVRQWWGQPKSFLLLHGVTGGGKTVAACSAFTRMRRQLRWEGGAYEEWDSNACAFETALELSRVNYFDTDGATYFKHLGKVTLLVLDDLGAEMMSESWVANLDGLLSERFGRTGCRTVLTSNVSAKRETLDAASAFEQRYGARIARRIRESGNVVAVEGRT